MFSGLIASGVILYYLKQTQHEKLEHILNIPAADRPNWSVEEINKEIETMHKVFLVMWSGG